MGNKICVIGVYFGKLPAYFPLWLTSCKHNPTIDFVLFTDQSLENLPKNVLNHPMTLEKMKSLADQALGLNTALDRPYKCCDFKAVYGVIFQEFISDYDYWGCCDFDLIFGDIQGMCDRYDLYRYDRFLGLGHLSLFRNTPEVNNRYLCDGGLVNYITAFTTPKASAFDEVPGLTRIYIKNNFPIFLKRIFADIAIVYHRFRVVDVYPYDTPPKNYRYQVFYWENGKVFRAFYSNGKLQTEEYMYVHFKKRPNFPVSFDADRTKAFYITNKGFFPKDAEITKEIIHEMNPYLGCVYETFENLLYASKKLWGRVVRSLGRK